MLLNIFHLRYGFRNWSAESFVFNKGYVTPSQQELEREQELMRQRMLVEDAKNKLLARFPFYAASQINPIPSIPQPVPPPRVDFSDDNFELNQIPVPPTPAHLKNLDPLG